MRVRLNALAFIGKYTTFRLVHFNHHQEENALRILVIAAIALGPTTMHTDSWVELEQDNRGEN